MTNFLLDTNLHIPPPLPSFSESIGSSPPYSPLRIIPHNSHIKYTIPPPGLHPLNSAVSCVFRKLAWSSYLRCMVHPTHTKITASPLCPSTFLTAALTSNLKQARCHPAHRYGSTRIYTQARRSKHRCMKGCETRCVPNGLCWSAGYGLAHAQMLDGGGSAMITRGKVVVKWWGEECGCG